MSRCARLESGAEDVHYKREDSEERTRGGEMHVRKVNVVDDMLCKMRSEAYECAKAHQSDAAAQIHQTHDDPRTGIQSADQSRG